MARYTPPSDTAAVDAKVTLRAGAAAAGAVADAAGVGAAAGRGAVAVSAGPPAAGAEPGPLQASSAMATRVPQRTPARGRIILSLFRPGAAQNFNPRHSA